MNRPFLRPSVCLALCLAAWCAVGPAAAETIEFIPDIGLAAGRGFDSFTGQVKRAAVADATTTELPGGQAVVHELRQLESVSQLEECLGISASGSYGKGPFNASAKAKFMRSHGMDRYSLHLLVGVKVKNRESGLQKLELSPEAKDLLLQPGGLELFHKAYGDRFVQGIAYGGEYYGMLRIESTSESNKTAIAASIRASGFGWSAAVGVQASLAEVAKTNSLDVKNIIVGGANLRPPSTVGEMIGFARDFPAAVGRDGYPVKVVLSDYTVFPEYAARFAAVETPQKAVLRDIGAEFLAYQTMRSDLDYVTKNPTQFRFQNPRHRQETLRTVANHARDVQKMQDRLEDARQGIIDRRLTPTTLAELGIPSVADYEAGVMLPPRYTSFAAPMEIRPESVQAHPLEWVKPGTIVRCFAQSGPRVAAGNGDMSGNGALVRVGATAQAVNGGRQLELTVTTTIQEAAPDWTTFRTDTKRTLLDVTRDLPGLRITKVHPAEGNLCAQVAKKDYRAHDYTNGRGLVLRASGVVADSKGSDVGTVGVRSIELAPVRVEFAHVEDLDREPYFMIPYGTEAPAEVGAGSAEPAESPRSPTRRWFRLR
jgi:hypothetical protein